MKKHIIVASIFASICLFGCKFETSSSLPSDLSYSSYEGEAKGSISVCASELPHAKILNECLSPLLWEQGYHLSVTVLDWTLQNEAVALGEYDANYFEHVPYLKTYTGSTPLYAACKVHYEKLCLYASNKENKTLFDGAKIELVDDVSNIERALNLLQDHGVLSINSSNYDSDNNFVNFDTSHPNQGVSFASGYQNCRLTCLKESQLCASLPDYDFGIIPGNTALTGLGSDYSERIAFGENPSEDIVSNKANIITVKKENKDSSKTLALVKACEDERLKTYISSAFGDSVLYHFESGLTTDFLAD